MNAPRPVVPVGENKPAVTSRGPWQQIVLISLAAVALYLVVRRLPTGTNLSHMDFRAGANSIEFCDPANPQFMPVVAVRSPVEMALACDSLPLVAGREAALVLTLKTSTGKPVSPEDLLVAHTQKLHLLIIDPTLTDYQHVHPLPGRRSGEWLFSFTPSRTGVYRVFADFTPAATARGLYARADLTVGTESGADATRSSVGDSAAELAAYGAVAARDGFHFALRANAVSIRAGQTTELAFIISRDDGAPIVLQPVMAAWAHLVAFDKSRSGFAHLHPNEIYPTDPLDGRALRLNFKVTFPRAGRYVIWAQVNTAGREWFVPFALTVEP